MADNWEKKRPILPLPTTAYTAKCAKKRKSVEEKKGSKKESNRSRDKTRIYIGDVYLRWRELRDNKGLKTDAELAVLLLNSYMNDEDSSTSTPRKRLRKPPAPPPPMSSIYGGSLSDRVDDFLPEEGVQNLNLGCSSMDTPVTSAARKSLDCSVGAIDVEEFNDIRNATIEWEEEEDDESWCVLETEPGESEPESGSSEEDDEEEEDEEEEEDVSTEPDDSDDEDYLAPLYVRTGGALQSNVNIMQFDTITMEETVHDVVQEEAYEETEEETQFLEEESPLPEKIRVSSAEDIIRHPASIAYHGCLEHLAKCLQLPVPTCTAKDPETSKECGAPGPFGVHVKSRGTAAIIEWTCAFGHTVWRWCSQPTLKYGMQAGDFLLSSNILLSGNNYTKVALLFKYMNMQMVNSSTFFKVQDQYCVNTIKDFWSLKREEIVDRLRSKDSVVALGDGRMDSPGFCAQYCTYTAMENDGKEIISVVVVDKRETKRNSVIMEKEGFVRTFEMIQPEMNLVEVCTDAHSQISALFNPDKGLYKDRGVLHTLDIWHGSKNLGKKIHAAGQEKGCSILLQWQKDICNHFWYCCKTASTFDEFYDMWRGLLHHVAGKHQWYLGACHHIPDYVESEKEKISQNTVAHDRLREIILNKRFLKDVHKYLTFRSTSDLESFHNHILMYCAKRFCFSPPVYEARNLLAALDYNHHVHRPYKLKADGSPEYRKLHNKKSRKWSLYPMKVLKDYSYIKELQSAILQSRLLANRGMPRSTTRRPNDPRQHGVLCGVPPPSTQEMLESQVSRGLGHGLPK